MHIWAKLCKIVLVENIGKTLDSPLWYNNNIGREKVSFLKTGMIRALEESATIGKNGEFYTFEQLKTMYNIKGIFWIMNIFSNTIPHSGITQINDNRVFIFKNKNNVT